MVTYKVSRELITKWLKDSPAITKKAICIEAKVMLTLFSVQTEFALKTMFKLNPILIKYGYLIWYEKLDHPERYEGVVFQATVL